MRNHWCRFHHLKLYSDDEAAQQSTKKPVVVEAYDEIVLTEPMEALFARIRNHPVVRVTGTPSPSVVLPGQFLVTVSCCLSVMLLNAHYKTSLCDDLLENVTV